jgi:hypothetical protein
MSFGEFMHARPFFWVLVLLGASAAANERPTQKLDEIAGDFILATASDFGRTLILSPRYRKGSGLQIFYYLYDYAEARMWEIEDPRLKSTMAIKPISFEGQFCLVAPYLARIYYLDPYGKFVNSELLDGFSGFQRARRINHLFAKEEGLFVATVIDPQASDRYILAIINLAEKTITDVFSKQSDDRIYWLPGRQSFYEVNNFTGQIDLITSSDFKQSQTLYQAGQRQHLRSGRPAPLITGPIVSEYAISFTKNVFTKDHELTKAGLILDLTTNQVQDHQQAIIVGRQGHSVLIYDFSDQEVRLGKEKGKPGHPPFER